MLPGRDVVGQARTGSGKTLAFALPIVARCDPRAQYVQAIVLVPTRELAIQVGGVLSQLTGGQGLRVALLYGGRSLLPERANLKTAQVVVGTPGRTLDHLKQGDLKLDRVRIVVLDEGDEMLDRGFAPDVERILARTPEARQTAMFSATMPEWVAKTAARHLKEPVKVEADVTNAAPPSIQHVVYEVDPSTKIEALMTLLDQREEGSILVFGRTKHGVKKLARQFEQKGYPVGALQGNLSQNARERVVSAFRSGELPILFATNVAARGLDIESIGQVINFELPESAELFTHRVGRTGRMGREGEAITFVTPEDAPKLRQIENMLGKRLPRAPFPVRQGVRALGDGPAPTFAPPAPRGAPPAPRPRLARPVAAGEGVDRPRSQRPALSHPAGARASGGGSEQPRAPLAPGASMDRPRPPRSPATEPANGAVPTRPSADQLRGQRPDAPRIQPSGLPRNAEAPASPDQRTERPASQARRRRSRRPGVAFPSRAPHRDGAATGAS
jgi:ATP-dependent RNA helicase DeaD